MSPTKRGLGTWPSFCKATVHGSKKMALSPDDAAAAGFQCLLALIGIPAARKSFDYHFRKAVDKLDKLNTIHILICNLLLIGPAWFPPTPQRICNPLP